MFPFNKQLWDYGTKIEEQVKPLIDKKFNADFKKNDDIWDILDFHDEEKKIICEIKGRKINHNQFPSTIIPMNKVQKGFMKTDEGYKVYFIFVFKDKTMYCELNEDLNYEIKLTGTNCIEHACIPINSLITV
tara:strand:- start:1203 stop:1598 length:396 start_codon:yes stop_codon:yes gene_type:complete